MTKTTIIKVKGREILDSRGNPTVEAEVTLSSGVTGRAASPSGASTGEFEALELRDLDPLRYGGKGVKKAVDHLDNIIAPVIIGMDAADLYNVDEAMIKADGTRDKSGLGANALLAVSLAAAKAASCTLNLPLYRFIGGIHGNILPVPMMNILNGGAHASNTLDIQEFMIMPAGACSFKEALKWGTESFHHLAALLREKGYSTAVGDEGGFAPNLSGEEEAIELIIEAVSKAGYIPGKDIMIAIDAAASEWKGKIKGEYNLPKSGRMYSARELISHWKKLTDKYPIISIEDPLDEEDWDGWKKMTSKMEGKIQIVGDDLFVTNKERLKKGIENECGNCILIKPNQIGTLSETIETIKTAHMAGYKTISSHRSGETYDTTIADLAVSLNMGMIKTGAPSRMERVIKYNRLLRIEEELGNKAVYAGIEAVKRNRD